MKVREVRAGWFVWIGWFGWFESKLVNVPDDYDDDDKVKPDQRGW